MGGGYIAGSFPLTSMHGFHWRFSFLAEASSFGGPRKGRGENSRRARVMMSDNSMRHTRSVAIRATAMTLSGLSRPSGAHCWNRPQPDQSGRCAHWHGAHQLAKTDPDLLRTLRGVHLRRSLVSVEQG